MLHEFPRDFYGQHLKACVLGFVRPEFNYASLGEAWPHCFGRLQRDWLTMGWIANPL